MTPNNAGYRSAVSADLDTPRNGKKCKEWVDYIINECNDEYGSKPSRMYCYYSSDDGCFYVLYIV